MFAPFILVNKYLIDTSLQIYNLEYANLFLRLIEPCPNSDSHQIIVKCTEV